MYLTGVSDFGDFTVTLTSDKSGAPNPTYIDYQANAVFKLPAERIGRVLKAQNDKQWYNHARALCASLEPTLN